MVKPTRSKAAVNAVALPGSGQRNSPIPFDGGGVGERVKPAPPPSLMGRDMAWWYWLACELLLVYGLIGGEFGFAPVIGLSTMQALHFLARAGRLAALPVQVRLAYLGLLLFGQWEHGGFIYFAHLAGTTALVLADYCALGRLLSLMPWNRSRPFTWRLALRTFLAPPLKGSILQGLPRER